MGNDIDKQENNNLALPGIEEGKLSCDKHYYLLYRAAAPYTVKGIKVAADDSNKRLGGARFALYFLNEGGEEILIRENLSTNSKGELCLSQKHTVEEVLQAFENGQLKPGIEGHIDVEKNVFNWDEDLFLYPGKYMLKETQAPEGYCQAEKSFEFEVQSGSSPAEVVEIQLPNERDPNAPPPPDPTPDPDPAPTPDPKPDQPDILHPPGDIKPLLPQKTDLRPVPEDHFQSEKPQRDSVPQTEETQSGVRASCWDCQGWRF